jgi:hypothetical protein
MPGPVLDERLELRELHLIAGNVGAQRAALEIVDGVLVVGGGVDAGRAGDQREGGDVDGLGRHGHVSSEAVEALLFDGSVDDREIGAAGGAADGAGDVGVGGEGSGDRDVGLAGEREHVGDVGVADGAVNAKRLGVFGLPVAQPHAGGEVRLQRAMSERAVAEGGAAAVRIHVGGEAGQGASAGGEVVERGLRADAGVAQPAGDSGVHGGGSAVVEGYGNVAERAEVAQVAGDEAHVDLFAERAREIDSRVGQLQVGTAEHDGVGVAVVVDVEASGDGDAASAGRDCKTRRPVRGRRPTLCAYAAPRQTTVLACPSSSNVDTPCPATPSPSS